MFDRKLLYTISGIAAVTLIAFGLSQLPESRDTVHMQRSLSDIEFSKDEVPREPPQPEEFLYLMREYEEHIAVFLIGEETPLMVLDTRVKFLPDYDRMLLESGIPARDKEELSALIEDYIG